MASKSAKRTSAIKLAFAKIAELESQIRQLKERENEPIAVVGMACRFPGAPNVEDFWKLLDSGIDAVSEVPRDRWDIDEYYDPDPDKPGKMYTRSGGFLERVDQFDAQFFQISPREAINLDPQHRLLLELSWEALEYGAISPDELKGSRTGVYMGMIVSDYMDLLLSAGPDSIDPYLATGNVNSTGVGRISYFLGLHGPNLAIDTACSSSLVAIHQACQDLRLGGCNLALAGGVNLMLRPETTISLCRPRMLSSDGRCKTFDATADGYGRGEGCGVVVLKRLTEARRDRNRILAVIRGSAVNQDGASAGLTVPNRSAQEEVIRDALRSAGIEPCQVSYLEAHGTGTSLGDPIEVKAAAAVLGDGRPPGAPLLIGSVKTNIGHLEAAAGVSALIKVILAMQHSRIPKHLHFTTPNPHIEWNQLPLKVTSESTPWPEDKKIAGITSFGFSGTNAHVIVEEAPAPLAKEKNVALTPRNCHLVPLSARSQTAVKELAGKYRSWLVAHPEADIEDIAFTASVGRSHMEHRLAAVISSADEAKEVLSKVEEGQNSSGLFYNQAKHKPKIAWLFTGQGSQYLGMGSELYATQAKMRDVLDQCADLLAREREHGLLDVLFEREELLNHTSYTQPALFALEVALARLFQSWGLEPDVVLGHSVGQYAAAVIAGVMTLEDGMRLISKRSELMGRLPAGGKMAAVFTGFNTVAETLASEPQLCLAADNGAHLVLSGPSQKLEKVLADLAKQGARIHRLNTSHAFHSALMDPILEEFEDCARMFQFRPPECGLICNVTGRELSSEDALDGSYWRKHLREPVQFARSIQTLAETDVTLLLEVGPQPVLLGMAQQCWPPWDMPIGLSALRQGRSEVQQITEAVAELYVHGLTPDFSAWYQGSPRCRLALPTYPFQRRRYYTDAKSGHKQPPVTPTQFRDETSFTSQPSPMSPLERESVDFPGGSCPEESTETSESTRVDPIGDSQLAQGIRRLPAQNEKEFLSSYLREVIAESLRMPMEQIDLQESLRTVGMDSLVGVEIKSRIDHDFSISAPIDLFVMGLTIEELAKELLSSIGTIDRGDSNSKDADEDDVSRDAGGWLVRSIANPSPKFRLFCLPAGGLGASQFFGWQERLPEWVEVCAIQLPGREERIKEKASDNLTDLLDALDSVVRRELDLPYAFYGHSMGGLVAYHLAHRFSDTHSLKPVHLFIGAYTPPVIDPNPFLERMRSQFRERGYSGIPFPDDVDARHDIKEVFQSLLRVDGSKSRQDSLTHWDKLPDNVLRTLVADLRMVDLYGYTRKDPLGIPITVFHGIEDDRVTWEEMQAWKELTVAACRCHRLPGDHFFLDKEQCRDSLLKLISESLSAVNE